MLPFSKRNLMKNQKMALLFALSLLIPLQNVMADKALSFADLFSASDLSMDQDELDQAQMRKIKKICKLCVGCLATDRLFIRGCEITCPITGATGATGATGPSAASAQYAYIYNTSVQAVPMGSDIALDTNGAMSEGFSHTPGTPGVTVLTAGIYTINFSVLGVNLNQVALLRNGAPIPGTLYGTGTGPSQNNGKIIIALNAGDVISLNVVSTPVGQVVLIPQGDSLANVNASIVLQQII